MISKCANPACSVPFHYLRDGKLFRMEYDPQPPATTDLTEPGRPVRKVEHFWLCGSCSTSMTLVMNKGKVETVALDPTSYPRALAS